MPSATEPEEHPPDLSKKLPALGKPRQHVKKQVGSSNPPVETPPIPEPPTLSNVQFRQPVRRILTPLDQERFDSSSTHTLIAAFAFSVADATKDTTVSDVSKQARHKVVSSLLEILQEVETILRQHPADHTNGSRFGNPIFRDFMSSVSSQSASLHMEIISSIPQETREGAMEEVTTYFDNAWGSSTRIDYGSGHELNFLMYLLCLNRLSLLPAATFQQVALLVFPHYLQIMRQVQAMYYLEPAGSHGVWGLDDYHFLPFLFGAAQLHSHPFIRPLAIHNMAVIDSYGDDYLYLDMVRHVNSTKTVQGLRWHSPMLDDISGVKEGWGKVDQGMRRMFLHEVIGKLVVMQHFMFGGLIPAAEGMTEPRSTGDGLQGGTPNECRQGHDHSPYSWSDCCGIQVPSSIGAAQEQRKQGIQHLRPLPFD